MNRDALLAQLSDLGLALGGVSDDTPIFSSGLLDSFSLVDLIAFVERETGRRMKTADVHLDNLDTIDRILAYANAG